MIDTHHFSLANVGRLRSLIGDERLCTVFQPLVAFDGATVYGYEALVRGVEGTDLHRPDQLFAVAKAGGLTEELEVACCRAALRDFARLGVGGKLFLNAGAPVIERFGLANGGELLRAAMEWGIAPNRIVLELTEHERVERVEALLKAVASLRAMGVRLALDDFGDGRSSLRLWAELKPDIVKIDMYFVRNIESDTRKLESVRAMMRLADVFESPLVAEGIETEAELAVLRDLGVTYGQGYYLGRPGRKAQLEPAEPARRTLSSKKIAVYPGTGAPRGHAACAGKLLVTAPSIAAGASNDELARLFAAYPELHAVAVVQEERPLGIVNRRAFMDRYAQPYHKEIYGRRPCSLFMSTPPLLIERSTSLDALSAILTGEDQRYLNDGFIITEGGRYLGLGTGEDLVRAVTELRVEAARHANPLTFLPGNIPITEHITRLLAGGAAFAAAYFDLNNFKPFNDLYGYWRGDNMIRLAARTIADHCDPLRDFVGHVGGDDFVVMFQSEDWEERCRRIVAEFNENARSLFDEGEIEQDGMVAEDRKGNRTFFPLTTLSIGAVRVAPGHYGSAEEVASAAAAAKRLAKNQGMGLRVHGLPERVAPASLPPQALAARAS